MRGKMANPWFRLYSEFASDAKVQMMSEAMQRRLIMIFCMKNMEWTLKDQEIAFFLRITPAELVETKTLFIESGFIDDNWSPVNWGKRQFIAGETQDRTIRRRGYVYYVASSSHIKIGFSSNPWSRLSELRVGDPSLELIGTEPGEWALESERHQQFKHLRADREWFRKGKDLLDFVAALRSQPVAATTEEIRVEQNRLEQKRKEAARSTGKRSGGLASISSIFSSSSSPTATLRHFPTTVAGLLAANYAFSNKAPCKDCGVEIDWWLTPKGGQLPMNADSAVVHMETCDKGLRKAN
jgi:hypothetical protein